MAGAAAGGNEQGWGRGRSHRSGILGPWVGLARPGGEARLARAAHEHHQQGGRGVVTRAAGAGSRADMSIRIVSKGGGGVDRSSTNKEIMSSRGHHMEGARTTGAGNNV